MLIDDQSDLIEALSRPETYGFKASHPIRVKQTNIAVVFLTGDAAYKLKKASSSRMWITRPPKSAKPRAKKNAT